MENFSRTNSVSLSPADINSTRQRWFPVKYCSVCLFHSCKSDHSRNMFARLSLVSLFVLFTSCVDIHTNRDEILFVLQLQRECFDLAKIEGELFEDEGEGDLKLAMSEYSSDFGGVASEEEIVSHPINILILYNYWERHSRVLLPLLQARYFLTLCFFTNDGKTMLAVISRLLTFTIRFGIHYPSSANSFTYVGMILAQLGDLKNAALYGELALETMNRLVEILWSDTLCLDSGLNDGT